MRCKYLEMNKVNAFCKTGPTLKARGRRQAARFITPSSTK